MKIGVFNKKKPTDSFEERQWREYCKEVLKAIENENLGNQIRFITSNLQNRFICIDTQDNEVRKKYEGTACLAVNDCLYRLWKYSKGKGLIDDAVDFNAFCIGNLSVFNIEKLEKMYIP